MSNFFITIDKNSDIPVYKQIAIYLIKNIKDGELKKNEKLPPERELSKNLEVSRGTVKKAYDQLIQNGYVIAEQGSGTFVSFDIEPSILEKDEARLEVDNMLDKLIEMGFDFKEISSLIKVRLLNKQNSLKKINIAGVDCNPETLAIIKYQLGYMENINFMGFLLNDVMNFSRPDEIFEEFDVIFTTGTHFEELGKKLFMLRDKLVKAVLSTDRATIVKIAGITNLENIGVITKTSRFAKIIKNNLNSLHIDISEDKFVIAADISKEELKKFISDKQTLILPPLFAIEFTKGMGDEILRFNHLGGEVITFNYTIERGSLIYIEEKMTNNIFSERKSKI